MRDLEQASFFSIVKNSFLLALVSLLFSYGCGPARHLQEGERLLTKVSIETKGETKYARELKSIAKQKPNRKLLGLFKIYLGIYNLYYNKENSSIKEKLGEAPVVYDSTLDQTSEGLMSAYLNNRGYYDNKVDSEVKLKRKRAKINFLIDKGKRYRVNQLTYTISDSTLKKLFISDSAKAKLFVGAAFDVTKLKEERIRVERLMKNNGYYKFSREYVVFEVDTFQASKLANVNLLIKNPTRSYKNTDSLIELRHEIYTINKVIVRMDYDAQTLESVKADTTFIDDMIFIDLEEKKFNQKAISRITYIRPDKKYSLKVQEQTYKNLSALRVFSYVSIQYEPDYYSTGNRLNAIIDLNPRKRNH